MRRLRWPLGCSALAIIAMGLSWGVGGVIVPPVISTPAAGNWKFVSLSYPHDHSEVEVRVETSKGETVVLRGLHTPSDDGAPLVVHFAGSGVSLRSSIYPFLLQRQLAELADLGFASLAVDYRGVGASSGQATPEALGADARAIWEHALELTDGDPGRIILRGCSLGSIAIAEVLHSGAVPGGVIMIAPVEASTVARNYGLAWLPGPTAWLTVPLLREFARASTVDEMVNAVGPRLVIGHPSDELFGSEAFMDFRERLKASGGQVHLPPGIPGAVPDLGGVMRFIPGHIAVAALAMEITPEEEAFLFREFAEQLHGGERLDAILGALSPEIRAELDGVEGAMGRLVQICRRRRFLDPAIAAAAACALQDEELIESLEWLPLPRNEVGVARVRTRWDLPFKELREALSLQDVTGPIPPAVRNVARLTAVRLWLGTQDTKASRERVSALAEIALDSTTHGEASRVPSELSPWYLQRDEEGHVLFWDEDSDVEAKRIWHIDELVHGLRESSRAEEEALRGRVERCLLRASGHAP